MLVETDYLVVGAGASGLAFADALVAEADVEVTVIDRRQAPGGHWLDAYPFVRLHTPSAYYGVNSLALGEDRIDEAGENAGYYERATGAEVCGYFAEAAERLARTGQVRVLTAHEHVGRAADGEQVRDLHTGVLHEVAVRRKVVDARYLAASVPATHTPPFEIASDAHAVPVNDLPAAARSRSSLHRARVRQDGGGRVRLASGQRRRPGRDPVGPAARRLVSRSPPVPAAGAGRRDHRRASPSMPRPARKRRTSTICSSGSRARGGSSASIPRRRPRCTAARCSAPTSCRRAANRERGQARSRPPHRDATGSSWSAARSRRTPASCTSIARRSGSATPRPRRSSSPTGSCSSRSGSCRRASTQPSWASSRRTATTTPTRIGCARRIPTHAASRTGRAW